jgi:hypothetical protein
MKNLHYRAKIMVPTLAVSFIHTQAYRIYKSYSEERERGLRRPHQHWSLDFIIWRTGVEKEIELEGN